MSVWKSFARPVPGGVGFLVGSLIAAACVAASPDDVDPCADDGDCEPLFGGGSVCEEGYCSEPDECEVDEDCMIRFGDDYACVLEYRACFVGGEAPDRAAQTLDPAGSPAPWEAR